MRVVSPIPSANSSPAAQESVSPEGQEPNQIQMKKTVPECRPEQAQAKVRVRLTKTKEDNCEKLKSTFEHGWSTTQGVNRKEYAAKQIWLELDPLLDEKSALTSTFFAEVDPGSEVSVMSDQMGDRLLQSGAAVLSSSPLPVLCYADEHAERPTREILVWMDARRVHLKVKENGSRGFDTDEDTGPLLPRAVMRFILVPNLYGHALIGLDSMGLFQFGGELYNLPSAEASLEWRQRHSQEWLYLKSQQSTVRVKRIMNTGFEKDSSNIDSLRQRQSASKSVLDGLVGGDKGQVTRESLSRIDLCALTKHFDFGDSPTQDELEFLENFFLNDLPSQMAVFSLPDLQEVVRDPVFRILKKVKETWKSTDNLSRWEACLKAIAEHGEFDITKNRRGEEGGGYKLRLEKLGADELPDCQGQKYKFVVSFQVNQSNNDDPKTWDPSGLFHRLLPEHKEDYNKNIDKFLTKRFWKKASPELRGILCAVFPIINELKSTKARPVADERPVNARSPKVSNSQKSVLEAYTILRSFLKKDAQTSVIQRDLANFFYHIHCEIFDNQGERQNLLLKTHRGVFTSDRLVFGLQCGPFVGTCAMEILKCVAEFCLQQEKVNTQSVGVIDVIDDFVFCGPTREVQAMNKMMDHLWAFTGFEAPEEKHFIWSPDNPTTWLGADCTWDGKKGKLRIKRKFIPRQSGAVSKREFYTFAGKYTSVTGSFNEALCIAHANVVRKIAGKQEDWDTPLDPSALTAARSHLEKAQQHYEAALEEEVPLFSNVHALRVETDASLVGYACVLKNHDTGEILYSIAKTAQRFMVQDEWHCNQMELGAILLALRKVCERLMQLDKLKVLIIHTDSEVAASCCEFFAHLAGNASIQLIRTAVTVHKLLNELERQYIEVCVKHIPGEKNRWADQLSRVPEVGGFKDVVFGMSELKQQQHAMKKAKRLIERASKVRDDSIPRIPVQGVAEVDHAVKTAAKQFAKEFATDIANLEAHPQRIKDAEQFLKVRRIRQHKGNALKPSSEFRSLPSFISWRDQYVLLHGWRQLNKQLMLRFPDEDQLARQFLALKQREDPDIQKIIDSVISGDCAEPYELHGGDAETGVLVLRSTVLTEIEETGLWRDHLLVVATEDLARELALRIHEVGHSGINRVYKVCHGLIYRKGLNTLVKDTLKHCHHCFIAHGRGEQRNRAGRMRMPRIIFSKIGIDLYGPLRRVRDLYFSEVVDFNLEDLAAKDPEAQKKPHILTICDFKTGFTRFIVIPNAEARTVVDELQIFFIQFGIENIVSEVVSDHGSVFTSSYFEALMKVYPDMRHHMIPVASPEHGGFYEVRHRDLKKHIISALVEKPEENWRILAAVAEFKVNSNRFECYPSPFSLVYGREPGTRAERVYEQIITGNRPEVDNSRPFTRGDVLKYAEELKQRLIDAEDLFECRFIDARIKSALATQGGNRELQPGDLILMADLHRRKHEPRWKRQPYQVLDVADSMVIIDYNGARREVPLDQVKYYRQDEELTLDAQEQDLQEDILQSKKLLLTARDSEENDQPEMQVDAAEDNDEQAPQIPPVSSFGRSLRPSAKKRDADPDPRPTKRVRFILEEVEEEGEGEEGDALDVGQAISRY